MTKYLGYENAYVLIIQYDEYSLIPILIHYYKNVDAHYAL